MLYQFYLQCDDLKTFCFNYLIVKSCRNRVGDKNACQPTTTNISQQCRLASADCIRENHLLNPDGVLFNQREIIFGSCDKPTSRKCDALHRIIW